MEGPTVSHSRNFWPFFFLSFFTGFDVCVSSWSFFSFSFHTRWLLFLPSLRAVFRFFFVFFFFYWVRFLGFFFFLVLSLGSFFGWVFWVQFSLSLSFCSFTGFFFLARFSWVQFFHFFFFFVTGFSEFGYWKTKKIISGTKWQVWGPQIVWKILSDVK